MPPPPPNPPLTFTTDTSLPSIYTTPLPQSPSPSSPRLVVGAAVLHRDSSASPRILLLYEETGLRARHVVSLVGSYAWLDDGRTWVKHSFLVEVEGVGAQAPPLVRLDPEEHQDHVWATEEDVRTDQVGERTLAWTSEEQKADVLRAFAADKDTSSSW
ncbi:hypothetical protein VdG2_02102 [Verticillium dahliae VDG2]|nr:hypothetical protein VdG2_02102 [Verticillium dahliae VDG2]